MNNNHSHFDTAAKTWDNEETIKRNVAFAQAIKKHLHSHLTKLMDFGCGTGLLTSQLIHHAEELLGIETSQGMLEQFSARFSGRSKVKHLAINLEKETLPPELGPFEVIVTAMTFHHLKDPQQMLSVFKGLLSSKGMIFIIDLATEDGTFHPDNEGMGVHHFGFSPETLKAWSQELGFKSFEYELVYQIAKNDRSYDIGMAIFSL